MMQHGSCECSKTELDVSFVPPTMTAMQEGHWTEHHPISALTSSAPIEFTIPAQTEKWTDLNQSYLYMKLRITEDDAANTRLTGTSRVSVVNNLFHSLFSSIDLYLNNKLITNNADTYPYRAYLENLLSYGEGSKDTHLKAMELWIKDTSGQMQSTGALNADGNAYAAGRNNGFEQRRGIIGDNNTVELAGRLHLDLFLQEKYLPNGIEIKLRLNRSKADFCIISHANEEAMKINIEQTSFHVRTVDLLPVVANNLNQIIAQQNMKIPIRRVEVKTFTISGGVRSKIEDHLFQGQLPKRIVLGMVRNDYMNGTKSSNPFDFQPFNLNKLEVSIDGKSIHNKPFEPDFATGECLTSYMSLFQATGALGRDRSMGITYDEYKNGYTLWALDLTADQGSEECHLHPIKTGNLRFDLQFGANLTEAINVIVFAEFDNQIEINSLREVITDY